MANPQLLELSKGIIAAAYPSLKDSEAMVVSSTAMADGIESCLMANNVTPEQALKAMAPGQGDPVLPILAQLLAAFKQHPCSDVVAPLDPSAAPPAKPPEPTTEQEKQIEPLRDIIQAFSASGSKGTPAQAPSPSGSLLTRADLERWLQARAIAMLIQRIGERITEPSTLALGQRVHKELMSKYKARHRQPTSNPEWSMDLDSRIYDSILAKDSRWEKQEPKGIPLSRLRFDASRKDKRFEIMGLVQIGEGEFGAGMGLGQSRADVVDFDAKQIWEIKPLRDAVRAVDQVWYHQVAFNQLSTRMVKKEADRLFLTLGGDWDSRDLCVFSGDAPGQIVVPIQVLSFLPGVLLYAVLGKKNQEEAEALVLALLSSLVRDAIAKAESSKVAPAPVAPNPGIGLLPLPGPDAIAKGLLITCVVVGAVILAPGIVAAAAAGAGVATAAVLLMPSPGTQEGTYASATPAPAAGVTRPSPPPPPIPVPAGPDIPKLPAKEQMRIGVAMAPPFGQMVITSDNPADATKALEGVLKGMEACRAGFIDSVRRQKTAV